MVDVKPMMTKFMEQMPNMMFLLETCSMERRWSSPAFPRNKSLHPREKYRYNADAGKKFDGQELC